MKSKLSIVKVGGKLIDEPLKLKAFLADFAALPSPKILVHGGGKAATAMSKQLGIPSQMVEGRRITSDKELEVVTMVYAGLINKNIVAELQHQGCNALGLSGADAQVILSKKRAVGAIDYGWVGDIEQVNNQMIASFLSQGLSLVFSAIGHNGQGQLLNTNADTIAAEIAIAMSEEYDSELIYCFEKKGVLQSVTDEDSVIESIDAAKYQQLKAAGIINEGMLPKLENCFHALQQGVQSVKVGNELLIHDFQQVHTHLSLSL